MGRSIRGYEILAAGLLLGTTSATAKAMQATPSYASAVVFAAPSKLVSQDLVSPVVPTSLAQQDVSRPTLRLGSVGEAVSELQSMLSLMGYYDGAIDGFYREQTQTAVVNFQVDADIINDGVVGPTTWQKLFPAPDGLPVAVIESPSNDASTVEVSAQDESQAPTAVALPVLRQGMHGSAVTRLQTRLQALGFYDGPVDGEFGPQTEVAVQAFQASNQLEADGVVGPATWSVLF